MLFFGNKIEHGSSETNMLHMKALLLIIFTGILISCNDEGTDTSREDTVTTPQADTLLHDNTVNRDTAPTIAAPLHDTMVKPDTIKKWSD